MFGVRGFGILERLQKNGPSPEKEVLDGDDAAALEPAAGRVAVGEEVDHDEAKRDFAEQEDADLMAEDTDATTEVKEEVSPRASPQEHELDAKPAVVQIEPQAESTAEPLASMQVEEPSAEPPVDTQSASTTEVAEQQTPPILEPAPQVDLQSEPLASTAEAEEEPAVQPPPPAATAPTEPPAALVEEPKVAEPEETQRAALEEPQSDPPAIPSPELAAEASVDAAPLDEPPAESCEESEVAPTEEPQTEVGKMNAKEIAKALRTLKVPEADIKQMMDQIGDSELTFAEFKALVKKNAKSAGSGLIHDHPVTLEATVAPDEPPPQPSGEAQVAAVEESPAGAAPPEEQRTETDQAEVALERVEGAQDAEAEQPGANPLTVPWADLEEEKEGGRIADDAGEQDQRVMHEEDELPREPADTPTPDALAAVEAATDLEELEELSQEAENFINDQIIEERQKGDFKSSQEHALRSITSPARLEQASKAEFAEESPSLTLKVGQSIDLDFAARKDMLMVNVQAPRRESKIEEASANCFCGFDSCCAIPVEEHDFEARSPSKLAPEPTMVSHGARLDVIWRVVAKTYIRQDLAVDSARIFPLAVDDEVTVTAIVSSELRVISPAVGWLSLVSGNGEPLVMVGRSQAEPAEEYPAVDYSEAFLSSLQNSDVASAEVIALDLCGSGTLEPRLVATVRRALAEGATQWRGIAKMFADAVDPPSAPLATTRSAADALQAAILRADANAAEEQLRRPSAEADLRDAVPVRFTAFLEELIAVCTRRSAKARNRTQQCYCGMTTCTKCSARVWEKALQVVSRTKDRATMRQRILALHECERAVYNVQIDEMPNYSGLYAYAGEEEFRPSYRLKRAADDKSTSSCSIRWHPWSSGEFAQAKGEEGEWWMSVEDSQEPLCRAPGLWLPPTHGWVPGRRSSRPPAVRLELAELEAEPAGQAPLAPPALQPPPPAAKAVSSVQAIPSVQPPPSQAPDARQPHAIPPPVAQVQAAAVPPAPAAATPVAAATQVPASASRAMSRGKKGEPKRYRCVPHSGFISRGGDILRQKMTVEEAKLLAPTLPGCMGFCYQGPEEPIVPIEIFFKNKWDVQLATVRWTSFKVQAGESPRRPSPVPVGLPSVQEMRAKRASSKEAKHAPAAGSSRNTPDQAPAPDPMPVSEAETALPRPAPTASETSENPRELPQKAFQKAAPAQSPGYLPAITSETPPPMWLATFVDPSPQELKELGAKVNNERSTGPSFNVPSGVEQDAESQRRYAKLPRLSAEQGWQLISLYRLLAATSAPPAPAIDLLSGLGDDAPEEDHLVRFDQNGQACVSPVELAEVLEKLGHPPQEVELWRMAAANREAPDVEVTAVLAILASKLEGEGDPLDEAKLRIAFQSLAGQTKHHISSVDLKRGTLDLKATLSRYHLGDLSIELTEAEVRDLILMADTTGDGFVSYEEFAKVIQSVAPVGD